MKAIISCLLNEGINALRRHRCVPEDARRDAELLLAQATGLNREVFLSHPEKTAAATAARRYRHLIGRRLKHEPVAYLLGTAWFRGREFQVSRATLIPRWATESLVLAAVSALEKQPAPLVVDVGTGSGCIAVTLAAELPQAKVLATDSSAAALKIARANARRHGVAKRVRLVKADLLPLRISASPPLRISAVIANLPYLPTRDLAKLSPDIRLHEPRTALDGGRDGLEPYRHLIKKLRHWPSPPAHLFLEILPGQYRPLAAIVTKNFPSAVCRKITNPAGVRVGLRADI